MVKYFQHEGQLLLESHLPATTSSAVLERSGWGLTVSHLDEEVILR